MQYARSSETRALVKELKRSIPTKSRVRIESLFMMVLGILYMYTYVKLPYVATEASFLLVFLLMGYLQLSINRQQKSIERIIEALDKLS